MLEDWYHVTFDTEKIYRNVTPPDLPETPDSDIVSTSQPWSDSILWAEITKVCFECNGGLEPDCLYIYTTARPESYSIPLEARGAFDLWQEVIKRGLFDATLAIEAASAVSGIFCWPASTFPVQITDHSHYQDPEGEYIQGQYVTLEEAQAVCQRILDAELVALYQPGFTAEQLEKQFLVFGQEAWCEGFESMEYVKKRCAEMCG